MPEIIQITKEEKGLKHMKTKDLVLCAMFVALIAVGAFIKIPVPVVPFTLQFLFTMLAGLLLVDAADAERAMEAMKSAGDTPYIIGSIEAGEKGVTLC